MRILGISCYFHDSAAALIEDGVLIAAAEEERFTRKKHDYEFPHNAIEFCLQRGNVSGQDLDHVVFFEKPFSKFDRLMRSTLQGFPKSYRMFVQSMRTWLLDKIWIKSMISKSVGIDGEKILFSDHHLSHAASSYLCSPFDEAAVLTFDGVGEWSTSAMGMGKGNKLELTREINFPHSIGLLYSAFTAFLGFEVNEGEYKVMGMAPYGTPKYVDEVRRTVSTGPDGAFWLDPSYFSMYYSTKHSYTNKFVKLFGEPRDADVPFFTRTSEFPSYYGDKPRNLEELYTYNQRYADIASSLQLVTEEIILGMVNELHRSTQSTKLCLAGGVALNSVANGRILRESPFDEIYIQPSAGDGGGAIGGALVAWNCSMGNTNRLVMDHAYWGRDFDQVAIREAIDAVGIKYELVENQDKLIEMTVSRLTSGKVIGWFQGRSEYGPRALGNRSILADPRDAGMKDRVNEKIKFREPFRPFAPSVPVEHSTEYFDLMEPERQMTARFMLLVVPVNEDKQSVIPAVSHLGTARIQTVHSDTNPMFHKLIGAFGEATGVPVLMNTSFNVQGEPVVDTPADALRTFQASGLDSLVMGDFIIDKP